MNEQSRRKRRGRRSVDPDEPSLAQPNYRRLSNPFGLQRAFSDDRVESIHLTALKVLQELGIRVLHEEARSLFAAYGADVEADTMMVRMEPGLVLKVLASAPKRFDINGGSVERRVRIGGNSIAFLPVGGPPYINDLDSGKRAGTAKDMQNFFKLSQCFDVIHMLSPSVEPQDLELGVRHLHTTLSQLIFSDKAPFVFARGGGQVRDCFEMIRIARGMDGDQFVATPCCYTVINTNSPRQLDVPMCQGIIDFARAGQPSVITPFTLSGAMAPVTIPGALTLQHAEALAGIALSQIVRPGAPVVYGSFTSNVDMKSGSPAFGTPEFVKGALGAGQLARHIGLPWRGSAATASNAPDEQAVYETLMSIWGGVLGGVNMVLHAAGWLEGGLTASPEKFILDIEMLQMFAEIFKPLDSSDTEIAFDAIAEIAPGGHFFGAQHTMQRYRSAFYQPLVSDWRNFGDWSADGARTAAQRANRLWREALDNFEAPSMDPARRDSLNEFVNRRSSEGGSLPLS